MGNKTKETIERGKETTKKLEENALQVRDNIQQKVEEFQTAVQEVQEAQAAISAFLGSGPSSSALSFDLCTVDGDCALVPYEGCCSSVLSVNKSFVSEYNTHPEWKTLGNDVDCAEIECLDMFDDNALPVCQLNASGQKRCGLMPPP